jgi:ketosteroid isomerase-like protein
VALALTRWTLDGVGPDGKAIRMAGEATDVLRRQADGSWRVALDNPWGVALLGAQGASST